MRVVVEAGEVADRLVDVAVAVGSAGSGRAVGEVDMAATDCSWRAHHMGCHSSKWP